MKKKAKIKRWLVLLTFSFSMLLILPNDYKHLVPNGNTILNACVFSLLFLTYFIYFPKIIRFIKNNILFSLPFIILLFATILSNGEISLAVYQLAYLFIFYFIGAFFGDYKKDFIKIAEIISFSILSINALITVFHGRPLSYSETAGRIFFIFEGSVSRLLACNMLLFFIGRKMKISKFIIIHYIIYILSFYSITYSVTGFYSLIFMFVFMLFISRRQQAGNLFKFFSFYIIILLVLDILAIFGLLSPILSEVFNKSETLTGRTDIWNAAIGVIKDNFLIGIGEYSPQFFIELTGVRGATHAHNQLLQILLNVGIIGFSIYVYYASKLLSIRKYIKENPIIVYYLIYLFTIILMCVTSSPFDNFFYLSVLVVVNYVKDRKNKLEV